MRLIVSIVLALHGIAHMPGFLFTWRLVDSKDMPYKTTLLGGAVDVGDFGIRVMGLIWLGLVAAFIAAAWFFGSHARNGVALALGVVVFSLVMCGVSWPEARIGFYVNAGLVMVLIFMSQRAFA